MGLQAVIRRNEFGTGLLSAERREKLLWDAGEAALLLGGDVRTLPVKSPAALVWLSPLSLPQGCVRDAVPRTHRHRVAKSCSSVSCLKQHCTSQLHAAQGCFSVSALFCHGGGC